MNEKEEVTIDLGEIFGLLLHNILLICLAGIFGGLLFYLYSSEFVTPKYRSSTSIYVLTKSSNEENTVSYADLQTGRLLTSDYVKLVTSQTVMNQVIANLRLSEVYPDMKGITAGGLASRVSASSDEDTRIITISVLDSNPMRAQDIADATRMAASEQIKEVTDIEAVNVIDKADISSAPVSPNRPKYLVLGGLIGAFIAAGIIIVRYILDDTIKTPDDVERFLGLSTLASIPYDESMDTEVNGKGKKKKTKKKVSKSGKPTHTTGSEKRRAE